MAAYRSSQRSSGFDDRSKGSDPTERNIWSSMLENVASGKRLPEKNILVLGGSSDTQKEFLESLSSDPSSKRTQGRKWTKKPPVANDFALGYTYHDVLDADHEDIIARLSVYLLADSSPAFTPLLQSLLTPETIPNTLVVILLDWSQPWFWLRQLRDWVSLLRVLLQSLSPECKDKMEQVMLRWRKRGKGSSNGESASDTVVSLPLGPGEWDSALGLPLCVVCQNVSIIYRKRSVDFANMFAVGPDGITRARTWLERGRIRLCITVLENSFAKTYVMPYRAIAC